jgi:uncharacterized protein YcbK (DUF882 family)
MTGHEQSNSALLALNRLVAARHMAGVPFVINSAYRCEKHNAKVGGVPGSAHTNGLAVDLAAHGSRQRLSSLRRLWHAA